MNFLLEAFHLQPNCLRPCPNFKFQASSSKNYIYIHIPNLATYQDTIILYVIFKVYIAIITSKRIYVGVHNFIPNPGSGKSLSQTVVFPYGFSGRCTYIMSDQLFLNTLLTWYYHSVSMSFLMPKYILLLQLERKYKLAMSSKNVIFLIIQNVNARVKF